jgi:hypothetical protein
VTTLDTSAERPGGGNKFKITALMVSNEVSLVGGPQAQEVLFWNDLARSS